MRDNRKIMLTVRLGVLGGLFGVLQSLPASSQAQTGSDTVAILKTVARSWSQSPDKKNAVLDEYSLPNGPTWVEKLAPDKNNQKSQIKDAVGEGVDVIGPIEKTAQKKVRSDWYRALKKYRTLYTFIPISVGRDSAIIETREALFINNKEDPSVDLLGTSRYRYTLQRTNTTWTIVEKKAISSSISFIDH